MHDISLSQSEITDWWEEERMRIFRMLHESLERLHRQIGKEIDALNFFDLIGNETFIAETITPTFHHWFHKTYSEISHQKNADLKQVNFKFKRGAASLGMVEKSRFFGGLAMGPLVRIRLRNKTTANYKDKLRRLINGIVLDETHSKKVPHLRGLLLSELDELRDIRFAQLQRTSS